MENTGIIKKYLSPFKEIVAYESLWLQDKASYKMLSTLFAENPGKSPSQIAMALDIYDLEENIRRILKSTTEHYPLNVLINGSYDYPLELKDAREPIELLYYSGNLELLNSPGVAVVGTRNPTPEGLERTRRLVSKLVKDNYTIISGLASGIDTMAHKTAIANKGKTIAVIGTPLNKFYPKENEELQKEIARNHLLISQVPFYRYEKQSIHGNRLFFPERNKTMSALARATVIVEASDTSGTLVQAKAALQQKRQLFILNNCFENESINWPEKFLKEGAIRVRKYEDIINALKK